MQDGDCRVPSGSAIHGRGCGKANRPQRYRGSLYAAIGPCAARCCGPAGRLNKKSDGERFRQSDRCGPSGLINQRQQRRQQMQPHRHAQAGVIAAIMRALLSKVSFMVAISTTPARQTRSPPPLAPAPCHPRWRGSPSASRRRSAKRGVVANSAKRGVVVNSAKPGSRECEVEGGALRRAFALRGRAVLPPLFSMRFLAGGLRPPPRNRANTAYRRFAAISRFVHCPGTVSPRP